MDLNQHFSAITSEFEKLNSRLTREQMANDARIRNDYLVRQTLENALKPNQDLNKAVLAVIELLKPYTCQGADNKP